MACWASSIDGCSEKPTLRSEPLEIIGCHVASESAAVFMIKTDFSRPSLKRHKEEVRPSVYLSDIWQLQDIREDVEAWGLQQRADSLGQC